MHNPTSQKLRVPAAALVVLVTILRPSIISSTYVFSLVVALAALSISAYEAIRSLTGDGI